MSRPTPVAPDTLWRRWRIPLFLALASVPLLLVGGRVMFGTLMPYDDEGYVLWTLRNFAEHGNLYREVYTQYGPAPYAVYSLLHAAGMPIDHFTGRTITLLLWLGTALLLALAVGRWTRSLGWSLLTLTLVYFHLWLSVCEPSHPGSIVAWLVALAGSLGLYFIMQGRMAAWAILSGLCIAALLLTKINIGVFVGLAFVALAVAYAAHPSVRRHSAWVITAGLVPLPFLLMRPRLAAAWVATLAMLFALAGAGLALAVAQGARNAPALRCTGRQLWQATLAALAVAALVLLLVLPRGTSLSELLEGTVFGPLRHPLFFEPPIPPVPALVAGAVASALACIAAWRWRTEAPTIVDGGVVALRLGHLAVAILAVLLDPQANPHNTAFWWMMPWLWVWVWPLADGAPYGPAARAWLGILALGQWLHAYPVPGTQMMWSSFLVLPLATLGAWESVRWLHPRLPAAVRTRAVGLIARGALLALAIIVVVPLVQRGASYPRQRPLALPGSALMRLPDSTTARTRILAFNAAAHAHTLYSLPGMFNFNLWSGRPSPTLANATLWYRLLSPEQQQSIATALSGDAKSCIIVEKGHVELLRAQGLAPSGALYELIEREYDPAFSLGAYEFRVRRGRRIASYFLGELLTRPAAADAVISTEVLIQLPLLLQPGESIARIEIADAARPDAAPLVLDNATARFESAAISNQGDLLAPPRSVTLPLAPQGPTQLSLYFDRKGITFSEGDTLIVLRRGDGSELALARIKP